MAMTTAQKINAAQLVDGQTIKTILQQLSAGTITQQAALVALTDSSGGTSGGNTVAAIGSAVASTGTDITAATVVSVNASIVSIKNDIATLAAKINAVIAALHNSGVTL